MKRFKFRLQRVLDFREGVAKEKHREFLEARRTLEEARESLNELTEKYSTNIPPESETTIGTLDLFQQYAQRLRHEISSQESKVEECEEEVDVRREAYVQADRDAEALKSLKSKKKNEYNAMILKEEEKLVDETTTQRFPLVKEDE